MDLIHLLNNSKQNILNAQDDLENIIDKEINNIIQWVEETYEYSLIEETKAGIIAELWTPIKDRENASDAQERIIKYITQNIPEEDLYFGVIQQRLPMEE